MHDDDAFTPETIEEQIDQHLFSPSRSSLSHNARVIRGLQAHYKEDQRSAAQMWERLVQQARTVYETAADEQGNENAFSAMMQGDAERQDAGDITMEKDIPREFIASTSRSQGAKRVEKRPHPLRRMLGMSVAAAVVAAIILSWALLSAGLHAGAPARSTQSGSTFPGSAPQRQAPAQQHQSAAPLCSFNDQGGTQAPDANISHTLSWLGNGELTTTAWNLDTYNIHSCKQVSSPSSAPAVFAYWSPDGSRLLTIWTDAKILDKQGHVLVTHNVTPSSVAQTATGANLPLSSLSGSGYGLEESAWSPDGKRIASTYVTPNNYGVEIWDAATGTHQLTLSCPNHWAYGIRPVTWSPDGKYVSAFASHGAGNCVWNATTGSRVVTIPGDTNASFSADSKELAFAVNTSSGFQVKIYNLEQRRVVRSFAVSDPSQNRELTRVSWSPDGARLAVAGQDVHIFNTATGAVLTTYHLDKDTLVDNLAWSPDSTMIASQSYLAFSTSRGNTKGSTAFVNVWRIA